MSPDIFWWGGGPPREGVGAKKFGMSLETQGIKLFWRDIPGFCRDNPEAPEEFEKKMFGFNSRPLFLALYEAVVFLLWQGPWSTFLGERRPSINDLGKPRGLTLQDLESQAGWPDMAESFSEIRSENTMFMAFGCPFIALISVSLLFF